MLKVSSMSPYTGKGASLAIADAMDLAKLLRDPRFYTEPAARRELLRGYVKGMVKRRVSFRKGGVFIQNCVFFGKSWFRAKCREAIFRTVDAAGHITEKVKRWWAGGKLTGKDKQRRIPKKGLAITA